MLAADIVDRLHSFVVRRLTPLQAGDTHKEARDRQRALRRVSSGGTREGEWGERVHRAAAQQYTSSRNEKEGGRGRRFDPISLLPKYAVGVELLPASGLWGLVGAS